MQTGYAAAKYDLIMISDAGIRSKYFSLFTFFSALLICFIIPFFFIFFTVKDDTLLDMVQHLTENTGLVHQMPFTCDRDGFAATLEKVGLLPLDTFLFSGYHT